MAEARRGYIYRQANADAATLRGLLTDQTCTRGWAWDARTLVPDLAEVRETLLHYTDGRAFGPTGEVRWRCTADDTFDMLLLTLDAMQPAGSVPLLPAPGVPWRIMPTCVRWQVLSLPGATDDEDTPATAFLAPDGSIQFVALIASSTGGSNDPG